MRKIIRQVDEKRGIVQITIADERWYVRNVGEANEQAVPSVTWISGKYPKGIGFYKWLADKGWEESQALKVAAGDKGSKVHDAITDIIEGYEVRIDSKYLERTTGKMEELTLEECECLNSFVKWQAAVKPRWIAWDFTVFHEKLNYAGTIDAVAEIEGELYVIDFKTSKDVWPEYELQVSAYLKALQDGYGDLTGATLDFEKAKLAILQIGYPRNKNGYKWNDIDYQFPLFLAARQIWEKECGGEKPNKREYPLLISAGKVKPEAEIAHTVTKGGDEIITLKN